MLDNTFGADGECLRVKGFPIGLLFHSHDAGLEGGLTDSTGRTALSARVEHIDLGLVGPHLFGGHAWNDHAILNIHKDICTWVIARVTHRQRSQTLLIAVNCESMTA